MAYEQCIAAIREAAGELSDSEIDDVISELQDRQKRLVATGQIDDLTQAALQAADEIAKENELAAVIAKRNAAINVARRTEGIEFIRSQFADRPEIGVEALLTGVQRARVGSRASAAASQKTLESHYMAGLIDDLERAGVERIFSSGVMDSEVARALWALDNPEAAPFDGPKEAAEIAKIINKWQETSRIDANKAGAFIGKLKGYITRQSHDPIRIFRAGYETWRASILQKLDIGKTFADATDDSIEDFLKETWNALSSGIHFKTQPVPSGFKGPRNVAKKISAERVLHFKDADSWFEYNKEFGVHNIREAVLHGLEKSAHDTGLMRVLGTNPEANLNMIMDAIRKDLKDNPAKLRKFVNHEKKLMNRLHEVDGTTRMVVNPSLAKAGSIFRTIENTAKLGGSLLSQFSDIPTYASEMRYQGRGMLSGMGEALAGLGRGRGSEEQRHVLSGAACFFDSARGQIVNRFSADDSLPGTMSRLQQLFFKLNGMSWWTDTMRSSATLSLSHMLALNASKSFDKLHPGLSRALSLYKIDAGKWDIIRAAKLTAADGRPYLTSEGLDAVPDEKYAQYLSSNGFKVTPTSIGRLRDDIANELRMYFVDRTASAVLEPDAAVRSMMNQGTQRGTLSGEFWRLVSQFKSFSVAFTQRAIGREIYGYGANSIREALANGHGEMQGLAQLMLWTTLFGYGSMSAKALLKGRTPRDPENYRTWMAAMSQGGGLGIYGDFLFGQVRNRFGGSMLDTLAGPGFGTIDGAFDLYGRWRDGDDSAAAALRFTVNNTPFANLFYSRIALDYLFLYRIQESMNPGYLRRMEKRVEKQNGQTFLIRPSEVVR